MFHLPVLSQVAITLWAVLLISESLSLLNSPKASQILSSNRSGLPSQMICRTLFLILASSSPTSSKTRSQKTSMSFWTLQGQSCLTASSRTSLSLEWVYSRITSMSSVSRQMLISSRLFGSPTSCVFFLLSLPFLILLLYASNHKSYVRLNSFTNSEHNLFESDTKQRKTGGKQKGLQKGCYLCQKAGMGV